MTDKSASFTGSIPDAVAAALVRVGGDNPYRSLGRALVVMARAA